MATRFDKFKVKAQEARDLTRFDLAFDLPDHLLPEFPPPIYLTTRPDLGDVSQGKLVTIGNYYEIFTGILNPKQLEGLRLLLTPFAQHAPEHRESRCRPAQVPAQASLLQRVPGPGELPVGHQRQPAGRDFGASRRPAGVSWRGRRRACPRF